MANDVNRVSPSKYDIYEKLLDIAKNYTDTENTDYLKTGLFGYITESTAMLDEIFKRESDEKTSTGYFIN